MNTREMRRLFGYSHWAMGEALRGLERAGCELPAARRLLAHLIAAELLWLRRLGADGPEVKVWPGWTLAECAAELASLPARWNALLAECERPGGPVREVAYVNSKGESWTSSVEDILHHVLFHGAYHRGQIASRMRDAGVDPVYTDYIHARRQGLVE